jgi:biotin operon repressor
MRRADRLFDIIQNLRTAAHPVTAAALANKLEVTVRMIYCDIEALHGSRIPIEGAPRRGYVLTRSPTRCRPDFAGWSTWTRFAGCGGSTGTQRTTRRVGCQHLRGRSSWLSAPTSGHGDKWKFGAFWESGGYHCTKRL